MNRLLERIHDRPETADALPIQIASRGVLDVMIQRQAIESGLFGFVRADERAEFRRIDE